jgi:hypothetical protein
MVAGPEERAGLGHSSVPCLIAETAMSQRFESVWYATPEKVQSMTKFIVFSDRGTLDVLPGGLQYHGKKVSLSMPKVVAVALTRQQIPWLTYVIVNIAMVVYFAVTYANRLNLGVLVGILVGANLFGILIGASTKWVMVEYQDEANQQRKAYFADGSLLGWGGILGGTAGLYHALEGHARNW